MGRGVVRFSGPAAHVLLGAPRAPSPIPHSLAEALMFRSVLHRTARLVALLVSFQAASARAQAPAERRAAERPMSDYLAMSEAEGAFRGAVDAFVAAAIAGDTARVATMISPSMRERAGREAVQRVVTTQVLPFFADAASLGRSVTVTNTTDQFGHTGFAYYLYATAKGSGEQRPFVLYVVAEGGKPVVANVLVNRLVEGRHR
jgi:hypothetical protein